MTDQSADMTDFFELMELSTASVIGHFRTEDEAIAIVWNVISAEGVEAIDELALSHKPDGKQPRLIASGSELADRALAYAASRA